MVLWEHKEVVPCPGVRASKKNFLEKKTSSLILRELVYMTQRSVMPKKLHLFDEKNHCSAFWLRSSVGGKYYILYKLYKSKA